jgi:hypothetical protein
MKHSAFLSGLLLLFCTGVLAQPKPSGKATTTKLSTPAVASASPATTTTTSGTKTTTSSAAVPVLDKVIKSPTKIVTLRDAAFKSTPKYSTRKAKYDKNEDGSQMQKDITYPDKSILHLKMVKNPSFAGQPNSINSTAKVKSKNTKKEDGKQWDCATDDVSVTANSTTFLNANFAAVASYIYPGAIYTFKSFNDGTYNPQSGTRNPLSLVINNLDVNGSSYITVSNPWMGTLTNAAKTLTRELPTKTAGAEDFVYQTYETGNSATQALQVSGGASGYGANISASYGTSSSSNSINITLDATKVMYTIDSYPPDSGYFVSANDEKTPNLMVIGSVSYGVRVLCNLTYTFNSASEAAAFKASYSGWGVSANIGLSDISTSSNVSTTINCYVVGGPANIAPSFDKKDLEKTLKQIFAGATYQNAQPISYNMFDMAGDMIGSSSATDHFAVQQCVPNTTGGKLLSVYATFTNSSGKRGDDHYNLYLYSNDGISKQAGGTNNYNGGGNGGVNVDPSIASFKTGAVNVDYQAGQNNTVAMGINPAFGAYFGNEKPDVNMDWFVNHGGIIHLHIYPNGSDTWQIRQLQLQLNFEGGIQEVVTFPQFTVADYSTEMTLYFTGAFKPQQQ